jgi:hypothetical protein
MTTKTHNLDIKMYSFKELLDLFDLTDKIEEKDLKRAKMKVLMTHPDKSRLPSEYFLFYKQAFQMVIDYYITNQRTSAQVTRQSYNPTLNGKEDTIATPLKSAIKKIKPEDFNKKFNRLFDENMTKKTDTKKNDWFSNETPIFDPSEISHEGITKQNMGHVLDKYKEKTAAMVQYTGIRELHSSTSGMSNLYDDDDEENEYVTSDPFSKLKYDDLRKVHKDQTVLAISERDFVPRYESTDHLARVRASQSIIPLEQREAERMIAEREESHRKKMLERQHQSNLESMGYQEKSKAVVASFLKIKY